MPVETGTLEDYANRLRVEAASPSTDPWQAAQARFWAEAVSRLIQDSQTDNLGIEPPESQE